MIRRTQTPTGKPLKIPNKIIRQAKIKNKDILGTKCRKHTRIHSYLSRQIRLNRHKWFHNCKTRSSKVPRLRNRKTKHSKSQSLEHQ